MRASLGIWKRAAATAFAALLAPLAFAPLAQAAFGIANPAATPASTNAGANADVQLGFDVTDPSHDLKDLTIHLPPGLIGNPQATPMCTEAQLNADSCMPVTKVGTTATTALLLGVTPLSVPGDVYNVVPHAGEPARFGIVLRPVSVPPLPPVVPPIILQSAASLRPSDLGLDTVLKGLPNTASGLPIDITAVSLTLNGMAGSPPKGFIRLPTSCKTHTVGFDAKSYDNQTATAQATFTTTNCDALPFTPEFSAHIKQGAAGEAAELTTTISQTIEEAGLRDAQVTLPHDLSGNAPVLANMCPEAAFQAGTCPANTIVGSAVATSPLQSQALSGPVAIVAPTAPGFPDLGIDLRGPLALKVKGHIALTQEGRSQVTFVGLPDIPIADFSLTFAGGPGGLNLPARNLCDPPPLLFDVSFVSHSGATRTVNPAATVECSGGGNGHGRRPRAKVKLGKLGSDEPTLKLRVKAGSEKLRSATLKLPRQLGFAHGKDFDHGTSVAKISVKHTARLLKLKASKPAQRFAAKLADGALTARKGLRPDEKLKFKLKLRDAAGKTTKLTVRAS